MNDLTFSPTKSELQLPKAPIYSICMCNYNMATTLEVSLNSLLRQLDERFEVVIVDDGSSDDSVSIISCLAKDYPALRLIALDKHARGIERLQPGPDPKPMHVNFL